MRLTTSLLSWGKVSWLCCVQVPRWQQNLWCCAVLSFVINTFRRDHISYWFDKPWFLTEGNFLVHSSYLPLGVSQRTCELHVSSQFSDAVARELRSLLSQQVSTSLNQSVCWRREVQAFCKGSLSLPIFLLCYCLA